VRCASIPSPFVEAPPGVGSSSFAFTPPCGVDKKALSRVGDPVLHRAALFLEMLRDMNGHRDDAKVFTGYAATRAVYL
jgi:hypothetical protein